MRQLAMRAQWKHTRLPPLKKLKSDSLWTAGGVGACDSRSSDFDAPAMPGAYLMNLGEMLETATDGYLKATPHRVVSPPAGRDRISIAYFFNPRFELPFERVELPPALAAAAPGADHDGVGLKVFGENNLKTRLRSHPDVARRHYADLGAT